MKFNGETLAKNISFAIKQRNMTVEGLAEKSGVSVSTIKGYIHNYELAKDSPRLDRILKIARALKISVEELTGFPTDHFGPESELLEIFRQADNKGRTAIFNAIKVLAPAFDNTKSRPD